MKRIIIRILISVACVIPGTALLWGVDPVFRTTTPTSVVNGAGNLTTAGAVPYVSAAGVLNQDQTSNGQFFWDSSNHRMGLGTATPGAILHVFGTAGNQAWFASSTANGAGSGGSLSAFTTNLPSAADQRLGLLTLGYLNGSTARNAAAIEAYSAEAWTEGAAQGTYVNLQITVPTTAVRATAARVDGSTTAGDTRLLLYDVTAGTLVRVSRGASDSGGSGFRLLRVPN